MGQSLPALCVECGGEFKLKDHGEVEDDDQRLSDSDDQRGGEGT
jgi:hypothetical protein